MTTTLRLRLRREAHYLKACARLLNAVADACLPSDVAFTDEMNENHVRDMVREVLIMWRVLDDTVRKAA